MRLGKEARIGTRQLLDARELLGETTCRWIDDAIDELIVLYGKAILCCTYRYAKDLPSHLRKHRSANAVYATGPREGLSAWNVKYRHVALFPEHPAIELGFYDGVNLAACYLKRWVRCDDFRLQRVYEGMAHAIQHVMRCHAERKGARHRLVLVAHVADTRPQRHEGLTHLLGMHAIGKLVAPPRDHGTHAEARPEWVGALIANKEGKEVFLAGQDTFGK